MAKFNASKLLNESMAVKAALNATAASALAAKTAKVNRTLTAAVAAKNVTWAAKNWTAIKG